MLYNQNISFVYDVANEVQPIYGYIFTLDNQSGLYIELISTWNLQYSFFF